LQNGKSNNFRHLYSGVYPKPMDSETKLPKISIDQFKEIVKLLPELRGGAAEFSKLIKKMSAEKLASIFESDCLWSEMYELPLEQFLIGVIGCIGEMSDLIASFESTSPSQEFIRRASQWGVEDEFKLPEGVKERHVLVLVYALQRQILSIMLFNRSLSALVAEAAAGNLESLFLAVRLDRSVVSCPSIALRIAKAQFLDDTRFFIHLRSALKGPRSKHWESYKDLRFAFALIRGVGFDALSDEQLETLLVDQLGLYPKVPGARKNLRKQMAAAKKIAITSI
jgi:hypothetical protein